MSYHFIHHTGLYPDTAAGELIDAGVRRLLDHGVPWGQPRPGRLNPDMRRRLVPANADRLALFDGVTDGLSAGQTEQLTRLACVLLVGETLLDYVTALSDPFRETNSRWQELAAAVLPHWSDPPERRELRRLSVELDRVEPSAESAELGGDSLGVDYADFRAVFRTFAERARYFHETGRTAQRPKPTGNPADFRRLAVHLELAIAEVLEYRTDSTHRLDDMILELVDEVIEVRELQHGTSGMLNIHRQLRRHPRERQDHGTPGATVLQQVLTNLAQQNRLGGDAQSGRSSTPASGRDIERLVEAADQYVAGRGRDGILSTFAEKLPAVITALTQPGGPADEIESAADARWRLLSASGLALSRQPAAHHTIAVAKSFAELGWTVADERAPSDMRSVNDPVYKALLKLENSEFAPDLAGSLTRIMRVRPLADSKKANFAMAQKAAHESVIYGSRALEALMASPSATVQRIVDALSGLQLSLLQAGEYLFAAPKRS
ncbi:hypothetical protein ACFQZ4_09805 [Catellatospora coxensis]